MIQAPVDGGMRAFELLVHVLDSKLVQTIGEAARSVLDVVLVVHADVDVQAMQPAQRIGTLLDPFQEVEGQPVAPALLVYGAGSKVERKAD